MRFSLILLTISSALAQDAGATHADWPHYGGTQFSWRYSALDQINTSNVKGLTPARGADLFKEAVRGFGRCSTCHEVGGFGIPVAAPIAKVPASASALKALATPNVKTAALEGESIPALVLSEGKQGPVFYDPTSAPPVQRNAPSGAVKFSDGSEWRHSSAIGAYNDSELTAILAYLRAVIKP